MSKRLELKDALRAVEVNKPYPSKQSFVPPQTRYREAAADKIEDSLASGDLPAAALPQGSLTEGRLPAHTDFNSSIETGDPLPEQQKVSEGNSTQGNPPQVNLPQVNLPEVEIDTEVDGLEEDADNETTGSDSGFNFDFEHHQKERAGKRRVSMVYEAHKVHVQLSQAAQKCLLDQYQASGWGKLAHCLTRQLKSPGRHRLKLVDVAVILTVYDFTFAAVDSRVFAPISIVEFEESTGMDEKNIRKALRELVERKVLRKLTWKSVNFWAINLDYFLAHAQNSTPGKRPLGQRSPGNLPRGNAPCDNSGKTPSPKAGQITPSSTAASTQNISEKQFAKNPLQEPSKESSQSYSGTSNFPDDLLARWKNQETKTSFGIVRREKEIFQKLLEAHGSEVFDYCGRVLAFLEVHGTGKDESSKVHCPMIYIENHWADNLERYREWIKADGKKKDLEAKAKAALIAKAAKAKEETRKLAESEALKGSVLTDLADLLGAAGLDVFAEEAVESAQLPHLLNSWTKARWDSVLVQNHVVNYFLEVQANQRHSKVYSELQGRTA